MIECDCCRTEVAREDMIRVPLPHIVALVVWICKECAVVIAEAAEEEGLLE